MEVGAGSFGILSAFHAGIVSVFFFFFFWPLISYAKDEEIVYPASALWFI